MTLWGVRGWTFQTRNVVSTAFSVRTFELRYSLDPRGYVAFPYPNVGP